ANHLPNGALLTALENVVKHNTAADGNTISTQIIIEKKVVRIVNSLSKKENGAESMGTGLKNLQKRYELLSDRNLEIEATENTFTVVLPLLNLLK
ncbi:MAG: histidine kinase, partial [Bacteroidota bacterium]